VIKDLLEIKNLTKYNKKKHMNYYIYLRKVNLKKYICESHLYIMISNNTSNLECRMVKKNT